MADGAFKPRNRMPLWLSTILIVMGVALAFIGLIPIVGDIIDPVSEAFFDMIFYMRRAPMTQNTKLIITSLVGVILGFIPEIGDFISDIGELALKIYIIRKDDTLFNKQQIALQKQRDRMRKMSSA